METEQAALQVHDIPNLLQAMYLVRLQEGAAPWKADGDPVPADFVALRDGLLPVILRQGFELARALGREDLYRESVRIHPDDHGILGVRAEILPMDLHKKMLLLSILQASLPLLDRQENILDAWEHPADPLALLDSGQLPEMFRGLRVSHLFDDAPSEFLYPEEDRQPDSPEPGSLGPDSDFRIH